MEQVCANLLKAKEDETPEARPAQPQTYLQALLGGTGAAPQAPASPPTQSNLDEDLIHTSPSVDHTTSKAVSTCTVSASGGSMSASINNPDFALVKRNRSVSFSVPTSLPYTSPLGGRAHTSEAGSPTLEQVLLMSSKSSGGDNAQNSFSVPNSAVSKSDIYSSPTFLPASASVPEFSPTSRPSLTQSRPTLS